MEESWLLEVVVVLNRKVVWVSFIYLSLFNSDNSPCLSFWIPLFESIHKRICGRKTENLYMGCRLVLIKYVLSLLIYFLFFFMAPNYMYSFLK